MACPPAVDAIRRFAELFPFPGEANQTITDEISVEEGAALLHDAQAAGTEAVEALEAALTADWE